MPGKAAELKEAYTVAMAKYAPSAAVKCKLPCAGTSFVEAELATVPVWCRVLVYAWYASGGKCSKTGTAVTRLVEDLGEATKAEASKAKAKQPRVQQQLKVGGWVSGV